MPGTPFILRLLPKLAHLELNAESNVSYALQLAPMVLSSWWPDRVDSSESTSEQCADSWLPIHNNSQNNNGLVRLQKLTLRGILLSQALELPGFCVDCKISLVDRAMLGRSQVIHCHFDHTYRALIVVYGVHIAELGSDQATFCRLGNQIKTDAACRCRFLR